METLGMNTANQRKSREDLPRITEKFLDVEAVIKSKNPRLARRSHGLSFNYLKRIIHQDELNDFIWRNRDEWGLDYAAAILRDFRISTYVKNNHYYPAEGRYLIASNHPLGGMDGIGLIHEAGKVRKDILFPVNDLLMNLPNLYELFIPVNKHGSNADNIRLFNDTFASETRDPLFPGRIGIQENKRGNQGPGVEKDFSYQSESL